MYSQEALDKLKKEYKEFYDKSAGMAKSELEIKVFSKLRLGMLDTMVEKLINKKDDKETYDFLKEQFLKWDEEFMKEDIEKLKSAKESAK